MRDGGREGAKQRGERVKREEKGNRGGRKKRPV
jgi:hypothetical protein